MSRTDEILEFIRDELLDDDVELDAGTSLFQDRLLDSLNLLSLVHHLEETHGIKIKPSEINIDNLDTVARIEEFLGRKGA